MKPLLTLSADRPLDARAEFRMGVRSVPYLADYGFQDMVVLPGSFYIEMALSVARELTKRDPGLVRNVVFHNPIILSPEDTVAKIEVRDRGDGRIEFTFYEADVADGSTRLGGSRPFAAKLEIDRNQSTPRKSEPGEFSIEDFQAHAHAVIGSVQFYERLRENGNQYGPRFQNVSSIWRAGDQSLGRLSVAREHRQGGPHYLHPSLLDSITQVLAPFTMEEGKTFILRSIEK